MIAQSTYDAIAAIYREKRSSVLATLIRLLGSVELAEEAMQDAFSVALAQWPLGGVPVNPSSWLISTGRHKAIDALRRNSRGEQVHMLAALEAATSLNPEPEIDHPDYPDDRLRLIFTCCHPALALEAQIALTLQTLGGLTTPQIAHAFLIPLPTVAQRIVRAKAKIRDARIPYRVPPPAELHGRLEAVMLVLYLIFNQGNNACLPCELPDLAAEAIALTRNLRLLLPSEPEIDGLLALMLLHHARRDARLTRDGDLILLDRQDRALWDRVAIEEGLGLVESALRNGLPSPYSIQAAIAAVHASAADANSTDWPQIVGLYDVLLLLDPSPVIALNRAVAVAMAQGPAAGLDLLDDQALSTPLATYSFFHSARGDLHRRLGQWSASAASYREALTCATNDADRRFLANRLAEIEHT